MGRLFAQRGALTGFLGFLPALLLAAEAARANPPYPVAVSSDLVYGLGVTDSGVSTVDLLLDFYEPIGLAGDKPCLVLVHGGGFTGGDKTQPEIVDLANEFAALGWVVASIDYRLVLQGPVAPPTYMPFGDGKDKGRHSSVVDLRRAIRYLRSRAGVLQIDHQAIFALGVSSGGFTVTTAATAPDQLFFTDLPGQTPHPLNSPSVPQYLTGVVDLWGRTLPDYVTSDDPPLLILHGTLDTVVPFSFSQDLADAADAAGMPYELFPLVGYDHSAFDAMPGGMSVGAYAENFLQSAIPVPEPAAWLGLGSGALLLTGLARRSGGLRA